MLCQRMNLVAEENILAHSESLVLPSIIFEVLALAFMKRLATDLGTSVETSGQLA